MRRIGLRLRLCCGSIRPRRERLVEEPRRRTSACGMAMAVSMVCRVVCMMKCEAESVDRGVQPGPSMAARALSVKTQRRDRAAMLVQAAAWLSLVVLRHVAMVEVKAWMAGGWSRVVLSVRSAGGRVSAVL